MNTYKNADGSTGDLEMQAPLDRVFDRTVKQERPLSQGEPSKPLLGVLPLARLIPQDVHSVMDYANGLVTGSGAFLADCPSAKIASIALAAAGTSVSALTDYRLSAAKLIPIEQHEVIDHLWGIAAIAAPFVFGYWKKSPTVALMHVMAGASSILASLFTDYRSCKRGR
ncbi:MAG TPA: hypothetical protein VNO30_49395 [Kofleriaceae bacterium]|nr:hypothetical protein [Kofleriaceae bacterium]